MSIQGNLGGYNAPDSQELGCCGDMGMSEWLLSIDPKLVPFIQIGASAVFAAASLVVAWAAFRTTRVNSFGTRPVAFFMPAERGLLAPGKGDYLRIRLEVWNRQKYPIVVRSVMVSVDEDGFEAHDGKGWQKFNGKELYWREGVVVDGMEHGRFDVSGETSDEAHHLPECRAQIEYYDPRLNKKRTMEAVHHYAPASPKAIDRFSGEWWGYKASEWRYRLLGW
jgi:hypothetical protein